MSSVNHLAGILEKAAESNQFPSLSNEEMKQIALLLRIGEDVYHDANALATNCRVYQQKVVLPFGIDSDLGFLQSSLDEYDFALNDENEDEEFTDDTVEEEND